jgi:DNA-binding NtrC family response regulator
MSDTSRPILPLLLVSDSEATRKSLAELLQAEGFSNIAHCDHPRNTLPRLAAEKHSVVVFDMTVMASAGKELVGAITRDYPEIPTIVLTEDQSVDQAVEFMKEGTYDYMLKPLDRKKFLTAVTNAAKQSDSRCKRSIPSGDTQITFHGKLPDLNQTEFLLINESMRRTKGNQSLAARILGITRQALNEKMKDGDTTQG